MPNKQNNELTKIKELPLQQNLQEAKDQIEPIQQKDFKNDYEPISEILKIEVSDEHQKKELQQFKLESNLLMCFQDEQEQKYPFARDNHFENKRPLKNVKKQNIKTLFKTLHKNLKSNSSFPDIIPINTIVIAKCYDQIMWPAVILKVQHVKTSKNYGRFIYKVNFIDSQKSYSLVRNHIIEFTPENIEKIKKFFDCKKVYKAFKIAEKMFNQQRFEENKALQTETLKNIIKLKQISLSTPIKLQNYQKPKPIDLVIQTPRLKPSKLILHNESYTDSDQQAKDQVFKKQTQKGYQHNEAQNIQQEYLSQQKSFKSSFKDKTDFTKKKPANQTSQLKLYFKQKKQKKKYQSIFYNISTYLFRYRKSLKQIKQTRGQKSNKSIENLFNFFLLPLTSFKIESFSRYSTIIDGLLLLCTEQYLNLKDQDKQFIKRSKKVLSRLYHTLKDYEGQNEFISSLKMLQLSKLKDFEEKFFEINIEINH